MGRLSYIDAHQQHQMTLAGQRRLEVQLETIRGALARVKEGTYGKCVSCGGDYTTPTRVPVRGRCVSPTSAGEPMLDLTRIPEAVRSEGGVSRRLFLAYGAALAALPSLAARARLPTRR
jgi:hypothetical protein